MQHVAALYKFTSIENPQHLVDELRELCLEAKILGSLLVACEGINGTVSGSKASLSLLTDFLERDGRFANMSIKYSTAESGTFYRMKVKLKKEIVTMGIPSIDPNNTVGRYVEAKEWNALIADPDTLVIDTRNHYETRIGSFKGALDPQTESFRAFPQWVDDHIKAKPQADRPKRIAMFCTGGIRCEKSTSYLIEQGFDDVVHLEGGILKYLEEIPFSESQWEGECFVFDQRVSVKHGLEQGSYDLCHACREPIDDTDKADSCFEAGVACPHCAGKLSASKITALRERQKQIHLAKQRGEAHIGTVPLRQDDTGV